MNKITASPESLMRQATSTINTYIGDFVKIFIRAEDVFGKDFLQKNPMLLASLVESANQDFIKASEIQTLQGLVEAVQEISSSLNNIAEFLQK